MKTILIPIVLLGICACAASYFNNAGREDILSGGVKRIPITTPSGTLDVWTKRVGNNPRIKMLLRHGGPGATHEYFAGLIKFIKEVDQGR